VQPVLFAPAPPSNRSRTSRGAAARVAGRAPTCRERIRDHLRLAGTDGATHEEIARATGIRLDTVKPRVHELGELGFVYALRHTRASSAGAQVLVFVATEHTAGRPLESWPVPRIDWKSRALAAERRVAELESRTQALEI